MNRSIGRLLAGLTLLLTACGEPPSQEAAEPPLRPVRLTQVYAAGSEQTRSFSGAARAGVESRLSFKVAGTVREIAVKVGDRVRRGEFLIALDPRDFEIKRREAEAALSRARAETRRARADYERVRGLYENSGASRTELDAARAAAESSAAAVESARQQLQLAERQVQYARLEAPLDGEIAAVDVEVNENVGAGQGLLTLISGDRPEVEVAIPEVLIAGVARGDSARVRFDALPEEVFGAVVTEVSVAAGAPSFPVTVELVEPDPRIRSGMAAVVELEFAAANGGDYVVVPPVAVQRDAEGHFVYTVELAGGDRAIVRRLDVRIGELRDDGLEIVEGVQDGSRLVTAGVSKIHDGLVVRLPR